jgi:cell division protein FtsB
VSARAAELRASRARSKRTDLKVVSRRRKRGLMQREGSSRALSMGAVTAIAAGAIVFGVLLEQVVLAQSAFKLTSIRQSVTATEARHEELLLEAAKLDSAARIERYARLELGMIDPAPATVRYIVADINARRFDKGARLAQEVESPVSEGTSAAASIEESSP